MKEIIQQLEEIVTGYTKRIGQFSEEELTAKPDPVKWSKKETLGHLIDSAQNNSRRFIVTQLQDKPAIWYQQDEWVMLQNYQHYRTSDLLALWQLLNRHICIILENMPEENYNRLCNTGKEKEELHTLHFLATDYITHHLHHLKQICP